MATKTVETIQIGPSNWLETATILCLAIENGTAEGKRLARDELKRMAKVADLVPALLSSLQRCLDDDAIRVYSDRSDAIAVVMPCRVDGVKSIASRLADALNERRA